MAKKRAFFSFDFDEDQNLKHHMVGQMKLPSSPFEGADWSMKEAAPERNWEQEAEARIGRSDVVVVLVGPKTHKAPGVLKEVAIYTPSGKTYSSDHRLQGPQPDVRAECGAAVKVDLGQHDVGPGIACPLRPHGIRARSVIRWK